VIKTWQQRNAEDNYLGQLDQILVNRLRHSEPIQSRFHRPSKQTKTPNQISIEINEELNRLESLIRES
jgi:hypothetical protein